MINKILSFYTESNLTKITRKIIEAYRNKRYSYIIGLCNIIDDRLVKREKNIQKLFSQLISMYHPDRLTLFQKQISDLDFQKDSVVLEKYEKIITILDNLDNLSYDKFEKIEDLDIEYEYGYDEGDFDTILNENELEDIYNFEDGTNNLIDFESLIKYKEFGSTDDILPTFFWEQLEGELNLSNSNLYELNGIEKCINIKSLDLSANQLVDIHQIAYLSQLSEINLSDNAIHSIDVLQNLNDLKRIDISFNEIEDISALYHVSNLIYINVIGNHVSEEQIESIKQKDRLVIY